MSAAEKLRALDAAFSWWSDSEPWTTGMEIYIDSYGEPPVHTFRNCLPQIVAVVEAAERYRRIVLDDPTSLDRPPAGAALDRALAALDKALT